ncbi:MAG: arginine decarboxylase, pyruvoyl-dependent [Deltaproteobacteria bacterium]|nr:arginine decarboxylase, pyruvoyl-dependent [Deltaproteobacteria bacterium]
MSARGRKGKGEAAAAPAREETGAATTSPEGSLTVPGNVAAAPRTLPLPLVPRAVFFTKGCGVHRQRLQSFELALRRAGIAPLNLVRVSSIFPPGAVVVSRERGLQRLQPGEITFVVMSQCETDEPNRLMACSVGLATPADPAAFGYLSEHHAYGQTSKKAGDYAEDLAATMLASTLGIEFDPDKDYDQRREIYRMSGRIVRTRSIAQSAEGDKDGRWTTVLTAAVLLF